MQRAAVIFTFVSLLAMALPARPDAPVSFDNDVMAVLSKAGCNAGACHGNKSGKGGFKLSRRGQDPDLDHAALTRDVFARRTNPIDPDQSLILLKPSFSIPHGGGQRFKAGSPEYRTLLAWLQASGHFRKLAAEAAARAK